MGRDEVNENLQGRVTSAEYGGGFEELDPK